MNNLKKGLLALFSIVAVISSQTISNNVQFTDMEGNSYDLFEELGKGKHILCHFHFNG